MVLIISFTAFWVIYKTLVYYCYFVIIISLSKPLPWWSRTESYNILYIIINSMLRQMNLTHTQSYKKITNI